ncbi:MAG: DUF5626 family protein [Leuconostoc mesenteroides]
MKTKLFIAVSMFWALFLIPVTAHASDNQDNSYDLSTGGTVTFVEQNENDASETITISENMPMARMANKTYTITKSGSGWHVSYKASILNNKFTSVGSLSAVATSGSFKSSSLSLISGTKAQWSGRYQLGLFPTNVSCTATISSGKLNVH